MKIIYNYLFLLFCILLFISKSSINNYAEKNINDYNFTLYISKINLTKDVFKKYSNSNDVNKGIYLANEYVFSNKDDTLVLASHSGNSSISYFKNLDLLQVGDYVYTKNNIYENIYRIDKTYTINKNGKFRFSKKEKGIYLITCDKKNSKKQLVFYGKMLKTIKNDLFF